MSTDNWAMSQHVVDWMVTNIRPDARVVELGGGTGSFRIHHHFENVITVEHDREWVRRLIKEGLPVLYAPLELDYYRTDDRFKKLIRTADVIVVDGPPGAKRLGFVEVIGQVKNGAVLIFDDTHRSYMKRLLRNPTIETIQDGNRLTTIQRATNQNKTTTSPMVEQVTKPRKGSATISHAKVEAVSQKVSEHEPTVQPVPKTRKRRRPRKSNSGPS